MNTFAQVSKAVGLGKPSDAAPPTVAQIAAALESDNRCQILTWWRYCPIGTINGVVGEALSRAMKEVHARCAADDKEKAWGAENECIGACSGCG